MGSEMTDQKLIGEAPRRPAYKSDDNIEVDDDPKLSHAESGCSVSLPWSGFLIPKQTTRTRFFHLVV
jgi:hypothetical protein